MAGIDGRPTAFQGGGGAGVYFGRSAFLDETEHGFDDQNKSLIEALEEVAHARHGIPKTEVAEYIYHRLATYRQFERSRRSAKGPPPLYLVTRAQRRTPEMLRTLSSRFPELRVVLYEPEEATRPYHYQVKSSLASILGRRASNKGVP